MKNVLGANRRSLSLVAVILSIYAPDGSAVVGSTYARTYVQKAYVAYYGQVADPARLHARV